MFRGTSPDGQCLEEQCFRGSSSFLELPRDAIIERLACEPCLARYILVYPFFVAVNSWQLARK